MNTLRQEFNQPIAQVERAWLRRSFVIALGPFVLVFMLTFRSLKAWCEFLPEFWKHWIIDGWRGTPHNTNAE